MLKRHKLHAGLRFDGKLIKYTEELRSGVWVWFTDGTVAVIRWEDLTN